MLILWQVWWLNTTSNTQGKHCILETTMVFFSQVFFQAFYYYSSKHFYIYWCQCQVRISILYNITFINLIAQMLANCYSHWTCKQYASTYVSAFISQVVLQSCLRLCFAFFYISGVRFSLNLVNMHVNGDPISKCSARQHYLMQPYTYRVTEYTK